MCRRNGMRSCALNHFNFASVWFFILSIEDFFPVHDGGSKDFLICTTCAKESQACVLWKDAHFILVLISELHSFFCLLNPLLSTLVNLAITDRRPRRDAFPKNLAYSCKSIDEIAECLFNLIARAHCSCGNAYCTVHRP